MVEGRTWWYSGSYYVRVEYGIRIGSKVEIDGLEWNKVYVYLHNKDIRYNSPMDKTYEWIKYDEDSGLLAYIREEDGKVYSQLVTDHTFAPGCEPYMVLDNSCHFGYRGEDRTFNAKIYDFKPVEDKFALGSEGDDGFIATFSVIKYDTVESAGTSYRRLLCTNDRIETGVFDNSYFIEGLGYVGSKYDMDDELYCPSLFYAPFRMMAPNFQIIDGLKYVTDGDNNIIYVGSGGTKLWEQYELEGVDKVITDNTDAAVEYYNLQGMKLDDPQPGTIAIRRQGTSVSKVVIP